MCIFKCMLLVFVIKLREVRYTTLLRRHGTTYTKPGCALDHHFQMPVTIVGSQSQRHVHSFSSPHWTQDSNGPWMGRRYIAGHYIHSCTHSQSSMFLRGGREFGNQEETHQLKFSIKPGTLGLWGGDVTHPRRGKYLFSHVCPALRTVCEDWIKPIHSKMRLLSLGTERTTKHLDVFNAQIKDSHNAALCRRYLITWCKWEWY